jgi:hypothetical protein
MKKVAIYLNILQIMKLKCNSRKVFYFASDNEYKNITNYNQFINSAVHFTNGTKVLLDRQIRNEFLIQSMIGAPVGQPIT